MRVLLINNYLYPRGGAEQSFFRLTELLRAKGHQVIHFACRHPQNAPSPYECFFPPDPDLQEDRGTFSRITHLAKASYNHNAVDNLSRLLRHSQPDIAHLNNIYHHLSPAILPVLARHNIPAVLHLRDGKLVCPAIYMFRKGQFCNLCNKHSFWPAILHRCGNGSLAKSTALAAESAFQNLLGFYRRYVDFYICPSVFLYRQVLAHGYRACKVGVIPNFIPLGGSPAYFSPNKINLNVALTLDKLPLNYLFCASRLTAAKGMFVLLEAARLMPHIPLLIAGDGEARSEMESFIQDHGLSNVRLIGWQSESNLARLFGRAAASIVPSLLPENCPNVVLESAINSCPIIAHRVGGLEELITTGQNGWLIEPGQPQSLGQAMNQAFTDLALSVRLGAAARKRVMCEHNPNLFYTNLIRVYAQARESHR